MSSPTTLQVRVAAKRAEAQDICSLELVATEGGALLAFTAGAHIDVHLPNGLVRQYSLCNAPSETHRYVIGVLRDAAYLARIGVSPARLARATHLVWGTGGSMVPDGEFAAYVDKGRGLQRPSS